MPACGTMRAVRGYEVRYERDRRAGWVATPEGITFPRRFRARGRTDGDLEIELVVGFDDDRGRMVVERLEVRRGERPVDAEALRTIPITEIVRVGTFRSFGADLSDPSAGHAVALAAGFDPASVASEGPTPRVLGLVAAIYRVAYVAGDKPTHAVAEWMKVPRSTAGRWVLMARRKGLLAPTTRGKARA